MHLRKITAAVIGSVLVMAGASVVHAQGVPSQNQPTLGLSIEENEVLKITAPSLMAVTGSGNAEKKIFCNSAQEAPCTTADWIGITSYLPPCGITITTNCISSVYSIDPSGSKTEGSFVKYAADGTAHEFSLNAALNLPQGRGMGGIWSIPGATHSGGNTQYLVSLFTQGSATSGKSAYVGTIEAGIVPVIEKSGDYGLPVVHDMSSPLPGSTQCGIYAENSSKAPDASNCVITGIGYCELRQAFPIGLRFGMTLKFGSEIQGWLHGRITSPNVRISRTSDGGEELNVEASPVIVPTVRELAQVSDFSNEMKNYIWNSGNQFAIGGNYLMPGASDDQSFVLGQYFLPLIKDKATSSNGYWAFRTLISNGPPDPTFQNCSQKTQGLVGVVNTNALVYSAGVPVFDKNQGTLTYHVLSPHFQADGAVAKGTYDLTLNSAVARCLYGFTSAPVKATISITSAAGVDEVATTILTEKDGFLNLNASGFTYSNPTINVKLTQDVPASVESPKPVVTPSAAPAVTSTPAAATQSPAPVVAKKITITCIKGKKSKIITGIKPTCPKGYKGK